MKKDETTLDSADDVIHGKWPSADSQNECVSLPAIGMKTRVPDVPPEISVTVTSDSLAPFTERKLWAPLPKKPLSIFVTVLPMKIEPMARSEYNCIATRV
jgi:hypothetical protein